MSRRSLATLASSCAALAVAASAFAFTWPADEGQYRFGFGAARDGFLRGAEFGAADGLVRAADDGELLFAVSAPALPGGYPVAGGSLLAVEHASGLMTVYSGMAPDSVSAYLRSVRAGDVLGRSPAASGGRGMGFYTYDLKEKRFINPLIVMPAMKDDKPPVIRSVAIASKAGETVLDQSMAVRQGSYDIVVDSVDQAPSGGASAPFEIRLYIDGSEQARAVYDAVWSDHGRSTLFSATKASEEAYLTDDGRVRFGPYSLTRGRAVISVVVMDYAGNKRELSYSVSIQ